MPTLYFRNEYLSQKPLSVLEMAQYLVQKSENWQKLRSELGVGIEIERLVFRKNHLNLMIIHRQKTTIYMIGNRKQNADFT